MTDKLSGLDKVPTPILVYLYTLTLVSLGFYLNGPTLLSRFFCLPLRILSLGHPVYPFVSSVTFTKGKTEEGFFTHVFVYLLIMNKIKSDIFIGV